MLNKILTIQTALDFLTKLAKNPENLDKIEQQLRDILGKKAPKDGLLKALEGMKSVPSIVIDDTVNNKLQLRIIDNGVYHGIAGVTCSDNPNSPAGGTPIELSIDTLFDLKKLIDTTVSAAGLIEQYGQTANDFTNLRNHLIGAVHDTFQVETLDVDNAISVANLNWDDAVICDAAHNFIKRVLCNDEVTEKQVEHIWPAIRPYFDMYFSRSDTTNKGHATFFVKGELMAFTDANGEVCMLPFAERSPHQHQIFSELASTIFVVYDNSVSQPKEVVAEGFRI